MKKIILILACVSICAVSCKQKTSQTENQNKQIDLEEDNMENLLLCQSCGMPMTEDLYGKMPMVAQTKKIANIVI
jgi:hypothetical protein